MAKIKTRYDGSKASWECGGVKVVFSDPSIEKFGSRVFANGIDDLRGGFYFYYRMRAYAKENKKWKKYVDIYTYDFPGIMALIACIDEIMGEANEDDYSNDCGGKIKRRVMEIGDSLGEDCYTISRSCMAGGFSNSWYDLRIGARSWEKPYAKCITCFHLERKELKKLKKCAKWFAKGAINKYNETMKENIEKMSHQYEAREGKIYEWSLNMNGCLESVICVGDMVHLDLLKGTKDDKDATTEELYRLTVTAIGDGTATFAYENGDQVAIPLCQVMYMGTDFDSGDERLFYNEEEVYQDFIEILTANEREEICRITEDEANKKWQSAIIDRTWMCRDEHRFMEHKKDKGGHENVNYIVREIIRKIRRGEENG